MGDAIDARLLAMDKARLAEIIRAALSAMEEAARVEFIARHFDAQEGLTLRGAEDSAGFLRQVEKFCEECRGGEYYIDENEMYEDYYDYNRDYYDDELDSGEFFSSSKWAAGFKTAIFRRSRRAAQVYSNSV